MPAPPSLPPGCRGEPYYLREELCDLHTAQKWRQQHSREVLPEQLGQPAKRVKKRGQKSPGGKQGGKGAVADQEEEEQEEVRAVRCVRVRMCKLYVWVGGAGGNVEFVCGWVWVGVWVVVVCG